MDFQKTLYALLLLLVMLASTISSAQVAAKSPSGATGQSNTSGLVPVEENFNCMSAWLRLSGATAVQVETLPFTMPAVQSSLDEPNAKRLLHLFLSLILGYAPELATNLKLCVNRHPDCPSAGGVSRYPCGDDGECVFNSTMESAVCRCAPGLTGERCTVDIVECETASLNHCSLDPKAECINVYGSYQCKCHPGYFLYLSGLLCEDIDECSRQLHNCSRHATCNNTDGSYTCACSGGYQGDGNVCDVDICSSSGNSELCRRIQAVQLYNENLESKLEKRDLQINELLGDMKLMASIFAQHDRKISNLGKFVNTEIAAVREAASKITHAVGQVNVTLLQEIARVEEHEAQKCGIVSWKTFTRSGYSNTAYVFRNVVFNKTRSDTMLRIVYTSVFGYGHGDRNWHCVKVSVLVNNTDCADPAPIISEASGTTAGHTIHPGVVSGVCNVPTAGPLLFTTQVARSCPTHTSTIYDGYSPANTPLTATLHIEELCKP